MLGKQYAYHPCRERFGHVKVTRRRDRADPVPFLLLGSQRRQNNKMRIAGACFRLIACLTGFGGLVIDRSAAPLLES